MLAALYHNVLALAGPDVQNAYWAASTEGALRKDEMQRTLARLRLQVESPKTTRAMAAARELEALEALIDAWSGEGAPSDAMIAWANGFLKLPP